MPTRRNSFPWLFPLETSKGNMVNHLSFNVSSAPLQLSLFYFFCFLHVHWFLSLGTKGFTNRFPDSSHNRGCSKMGAIKLKLKPVNSSNFHIIHSNISSTSPLESALLAHAGAPSPANSLHKTHHSIITLNHCSLLRLLLESWC